MKKYKTIEKWMIVELTQPTIIGEVDNYVVQEPVYAINDTAVITEFNSYWLGSPDKVWINTQ